MSQRVSQFHSDKESRRTLNHHVRVSINHFSFVGIVLKLVSISVTRVTKGSKSRISTTRWFHRLKKTPRTPSNSKCQLLVISVSAQSHRKSCKYTKYPLKLPRYMFKVLRKTSESLLKAGRI